MKKAEVDDSKEHINEDSIQNTESYSIAGIIYHIIFTYIIIVRSKFISILCTYIYTLIAKSNLYVGYDCKYLILIDYRIQYYFNRFFLLYNLGT